MARPRFHLAFPVNDLDQARSFYGGLLGCPEVRSSAEWVDFDLEGHQIVAHKAPMDETGPATSEVDGHAVPVRHFGLILAPRRWRALARRLESAGVSFLIAPTTRFAGQPGEQQTMFLRDPCGNVLEFKSFADERMVFAG